jgi:hypothetical protein
MSVQKWIRFVAGLLFVVAALPAQEGRGTITGRVIDPSGAAVGGAEVHASNRGTSATVSARGNEAGNYTIPYLPPGAYDLSVDFTGFKKAQKPAVDLRIDDTLRIDFSLEVGSASETIEVTGGTPLFETSSVSAGQVQEQYNIDNLPVQAGNANELVLLTPGVTNSTNLRQRKSSFNSASSQFTTNGNQLYSNAYTIDGIPPDWLHRHHPHSGIARQRPALRRYHRQSVPQWIDPPAGFCHRAPDQPGTSHFSLSSESFAALFAALDVRPAAHRMDRIPDRCRVRRQ